MSLAWSSVKALSIPVGGVSRDVKRVSIGGVTVWQKPSQSPYVSDGLIGWWDGIWNAGINVHNSSATVWKDLAGNRDLTLASSGVSWTSNSMRSAIAAGCAAKYAPGIDVSTVYTVELITGGTQNGRTKLILNPASVSGSSVNGVFLQYNSNDAGLVAFGGSATTRRELAKGDIRTAKSLSIRYSTPGAVAASCKRDGTSVSLEHYSGWGNNSAYAGIRLFGRADGDTGSSIGSYSFRGDCHCLRLYSRQLTDAEVAANYAVDKERFGLP